MSSFVKKINELKLKYFTSELRVIIPVFLFILLCGVVAVSFSFFSKTDIDLRTLAPKDSIIYLETNNLGKTLDALTESKSFQELSSLKTDFSAINGIQAAIVVSGFETSENQVTDKQSVLNFKPNFTVISETHSWSWQVSSLVENNLDGFVRQIYGTEAKLERKIVNSTERFIWTSGDGRKTFAVISGSQVFFGNDEESINKCLSAKRGETENLLVNENLTAEYDRSKGKLAFGFISQQGIKQIADAVGVSVAVEQSEDANARGFISRILPQILSNTTREIIWTAEKIENGIEDSIFIKTERQTSQVLTTTLVSANKNIKELYNFIPLQSSAVTRYNLKNPQIAFRSLLLVTAKNTDAVNANIISAFSNSLLTPYGVADAENFLSSVESELITVQVDDEESVAIVKSNDLEKIKTTLIEEIKPQSKANEKNNPEIWMSEEDDLTIAFYDDILIMGNSKAVQESISSWSKRKISPLENDLIKNKFFFNLLNSKAVATTFSKDGETAQSVVKVLGKLKSEIKQIPTHTVTETRFTKQGIERNYISEYGFLGTLIEQFESE